MDNEEINKKLVTLENDKMILLKKKLESEYKLIEINTEIKQLRRKFKIEGYKKTEKLRTLTKVMKELVIEERGTTCESSECKESIALQVHHIIPLSQGGTDKKTNLQVLCHECHMKKHRT